MTDSLSEQPDDAALRAAYASLLAARGAQGATEEMVSLDDILALVERRGNEGTRLAILDRVMASPVHRREFDELSAAYRATAVPVQTISWRLAAAAVLLVVLVGGGVWRVRTRTGVGDDEVTRGAASAAQPVITRLGTDSVRITWRHAPGMQRYDVEFLDESNAVVLTKTTADTMLDYARRDLTRARQLWVRGVSTDGRSWSTPVVAIPALVPPR
jgi:hypothetical protein